MDVSDISRTGHPRSGRARERGTCTTCTASSEEKPDSNQPLRQTAAGMASQVGKSPVFWQVGMKELRLTHTHPPLPLDAAIVVFSCLSHLDKYVCIRILTAMASRSPLSQINVPKTFFFFVLSFCVQTTAGDPALQFTHSFWGEHLKGPVMRTSRSGPGGTRRGKAKQTLLDFIAYGSHNTDIDNTVTETIDKQGK